MLVTLIPKFGECGQLVALDPKSALVVEIVAVTLPPTPYGGSGLKDIFGSLLVQNRGPEAGWRQALISALFDIKAAKHLVLELVGSVMQPGPNPTRVRLTAGELPGKLVTKIYRPAQR